MSIDTVYTIASKATGGGRDGQVYSDTGQIDLDLRPPKEMGGSGDGSNPEELFSAGYAACFLGALHASSKAAGNPAPADSTVKVTIGIGKDSSDGGFGLTAQIDVTTPGVDQETADKLAEGAHAMCPYSKATAGNIEHKVVAHV
ncbi:organic hydroperoxide resistance protein [Williamsia sp. M5A3_1d]